MKRTITLPCKLSIPHSIVTYPDREVSVTAVFGDKSGKLLRVEGYDGELPKLKLGENLKPSNRDLQYDSIGQYWVTRYPCRDTEYFVRLQDALKYLESVADLSISAGYE